MTPEQQGSSSFPSGGTAIRPEYRSLREVVTYTYRDGNLIRFAFDVRCYDRVPMRLAGYLHP